MCVVMIVVSLGRFVEDGCAQMGGHVRVDWIRQSDSQSFDQSVSQSDSLSVS